MVGFNGNQRLLGEGASAQAIMNSKNIITSLKHLIGKSFDEPDVEIEKNYIPYNLVPSSDQSTAAQVFYLFSHLFFIHFLLSEYLFNCSILGFI